MQITPAILTSNLDLFKRLLKELEFAHSIDIDITRTPFVSNITLQLEDVVNIINYDEQSIGFHLMVNNPIQELDLLLKSPAKDKNIRIYLHQESDIDFLDSFDWPQNWSKCLAIKFESSFREIEFYNQFEEIQLMSIETGGQGYAFKPGVVDKVEELTRLGYFGKISLDGGINLETIENIKNVQIDRISVGSYFQKSQNVKESYRILKESLEK